MFEPGTRVEIPSDHDAWKEGDKFGTVMGPVSNLPEEYTPVRMDSGRALYYLKAEQLTEISPE